MTYKVRTDRIFLITLSILILRQPKNHQYNETQNWGHLQDHVKASAIHRCPVYVDFRQRGFL